MSTPTTTRPVTATRSGAGPLSPRAAVAAAAVGSLLALAGDAYHLFVLDDRPTQAGSTAYTAHGMALMLGLLLLLLGALSVLHPSRPGRAAAPTLVIGTALVVGDIWAEVVVLPGVVTGSARDLLGDDISGQHLALVVFAFALFAVGWVLFALAMRVAAPALAWVLVAGGVIAFLPVGGSYVTLAVAAGLVIARAARRTP